MMAGRVSLTVGFVAMVISMAVGIVVGAFAGFYGGVVGAVLMRLVDAVLCFPTIFLLLALAAFIEPGLVTTTVLIAATAWMEVARVVEAQVRSLRERDFAVAALAFGSSNLRIMFRELRAQRDRADRRRGDAERRQRDPAGILCQLSRLRHPAAGRELGQHAQQRADLSHQRALARDLPGRSPSRWR